MTLYKAIGEAYCKKVEEIEGKDFEYQAPQFIEQVVDVTSPELVKEMSLEFWLAGHGWDSGKWIDGPRIVELPAEVVALAGVEV